MNTSSPSFDPSPITRLECWIDLLLKRGLTQCVAENGDDLESLVVELRSAGDIRAIARRVKRIKELIPTDKRVASLKETSGGLGSSVHKPSMSAGGAWGGGAWGGGAWGGGGWGGGGWGGTGYARTYSSPQADISDRALQLEPSYESSRYKVVQRRRSGGGDWVDELLGELSALSMLIELTRGLELLTPDARAQHMQRLGRAAHRINQRASALRQGELICLGVSERLARRYQSQRVWYLDPQSGELLYTQRAPEQVTTLQEGIKANPDDHELNSTPSLDSSAGIDTQGSISRGSYRVIHGLSPRQISFSPDSPIRPLSSADAQGAELTPHQGSPIVQVTSAHLSQVRWCDHFDAALDEWRDLLALDPFATRPLLTIRSARAVARWVGDLPHAPSIDLAEVNLSVTSEPQLPSINLYLIDERGLSTRVYASALDRWRMAQLSADASIRVIAEWSGDGLKPLLWCADQDEAQLQWRTPRSTLNHRLTGLSKAHQREAPSPSASMERLSAERAELTRLYTAHRDRAERGVLSELGVCLADDQEERAELSGALVAELRRDLAALWLWSRADLPISSPPPTYTYEELLSVSAPTIRAIIDAAKLKPPKGSSLPF